MKHFLLADVAMSPFEEFSFFVYNQLPFIFVGLGLVVGLTIFFILRNKKKNQDKKEE